MSIGVMSAARTNNLFYASVGNAVLNNEKKSFAYPFSPLRMAFATSFTPRLTWRAFEAVQGNELASGRNDDGQLTSFDCFLKLFQELLLSERMRYW